MALDEYGLTPKQRAFADEYIRTGNATKAAREAGYSGRTADVIGKQNLGKLPVKRYIAERTQPTVEKRIASADEVLQFLTDVMQGRVKDQFGLDASLQDRIKAGQELMKRYAVADMRQVSTMQKLDSIFLEFKAALSADSPAIVVDADSTGGTALPPATPPTAAPTAAPATAQGTGQGTTPQPATAPTQGTGDTAQGTTTTTTTSGPPDHA